VVSDKKVFKISANENTLWTLAAMLDFKSTPKNEHFWQVWLNKHGMNGQLSKLCPVTPTSIQDGHRQRT
jgi:hypothetical protein